MTESAAPIEHVRSDALPTFQRWLGQGGFENPQRRELPGPFPFTLITAIRR